MGAGWDTAVGVVLALWFVASVVHQVSPEWWRRRVRSNAFGLLPRWTFFAPNPAREDTHLVFRDRQGDHWSPWQALTPAPAVRRWRWVWNPQRYARKATVDLANGLRRQRLRHAESPRALLLSHSYVGLLRWVASQPATAGVTHRQFALVTSEGHGTDQRLELLFLSEEHRLDAAR